MTIRYYMDVHVKGVVSRGFRLRGIDVLTAQEDNSDRTADEILLLRATELNRILVTQDEDFFAISARMQEQGIPFVGVIYAHQNRISDGELLFQLELVARASFMEDWSSRTLYLPI